ncbi:MAG: hypothetical protein WA003_11850 [Desulfuromonadaceae bacterium]
MNMRGLCLGLLLMVAFGLVIVPFTHHMNNRPVAVKLGYMPHSIVLKLAFGDYKQLLAQHSVVRVLFYFGTLIDPDKRNIKDTPEFFHMFSTLQHAVRLDPYNMDAYYFTQAAFTWELRKIKEVNDMLDYGMEYRTWDAQLPFYAGMNAAYFLKDFSAASRYMKIAAERSGDPLYVNLTARYLYESGQTKVGLAFIKLMEKNILDPRIKQLYRMRREALHQVDLIEQALQRYRRDHAKLPAKLESLVEAGYLDEPPIDPYGGRFYLTPEGFVRSTSKFAMVLDEIPAGTGKR